MFLGSASAGVQWSCVRQRRGRDEDTLASSSLKPHGMDEDMHVYVVLPSPPLTSLPVQHNLPLGWAGSGIFLEKSGHKEGNVNLKIRVALDHRNVNLAPVYLLLLVALTTTHRKGWSG